ncbi:exodeoxyribonuclease III [Marinivivus vitaminiproducens]|uniref:exodeoxyribonuclease III n=1 Tax=Marinivivus vitaminiproducens TaxID=3035935 RepID=UPI0027A181B9|nr:exodeoxyribonuclease III [Geminicoccaceae bacterium SCSIO 64248]
MRISTWNINSVRLRTGGIKTLVETHDPDIVCLQEIKIDEERFPHAAIEALGFPYRSVHGQAGYHGVAILSKIPLAEPATFDWGAVGHARHQVVYLPGGIELHNVYVPAGGDIPDPEINPKFAHKLAFMGHLTGYFREPVHRARTAILVGDLNIAPLPTDVWSHKQLLSVVSHTPVEVEAFETFMASRPWHDAVRHFIPPEEKLFSWWSYRNRDWKLSNRGRRLDHILVTKDLAPDLGDLRVLREARDWPACSDHVPITVDIARAQ